MRVRAAVVLVGLSVAGCGAPLEPLLLQQELEARRYRESWEAELDAHGSCTESLRAAEAHRVAAQALALAAEARSVGLEQAAAAREERGVVPGELEALRKALAPELAAGTVVLATVGGSVVVTLPGQLEGGAVGMGARPLLQRVLRALGPDAKAATLEVVVKRP